MAQPATFLVAAANRRAAADSTHGSRFIDVSRMMLVPIKSFKFLR